jgi:hypothetical protein
MLQMTLLGAGLTVWNIWDLQVWQWRSYKALVDERERQIREERDR